MARKPRLFVPGATYHVYCRVARGEFVFDDPQEAAEFVEKVRAIRDADGWRIFAKNSSPMYPMRSRHPSRPLKALWRP